MDFLPLPKPGSPFFLPHPHAAHISHSLFRRNNSRIDRLELLLRSC
jgi:hypothetical protein